MLTWTLACQEVGVYSEPTFFYCHIRKAFPTPVVLFTLLAGLKWSHRDWHFYCNSLSQRFTLPVSDTSCHLWRHFGLCGNVRPTAFVCHNVFVCTPSSLLVRKNLPLFFPLSFFRTLCCLPTRSPGCVRAQHGWPGPRFQVPAVQRGWHLHPSVGQHGQAEQSKWWAAFKVLREENRNFLKLALLTLKG